ncbi:MAG: lipase family protein [Verrucomicrobiota bacterium]
MPKLDPFSPELRERVVASLQEWEGLFAAPDPEAFFPSQSANLTWAKAWGSAQAEAFSPGLGWWMAELCRLVYTPDQKEREQKRFAKWPRRESILDRVAGVEEILSIHKTGNHAAIFRVGTDSSCRATVLCFRGTSRTRQWIMNTVTRPHRWRRFEAAGTAPGARVHSGFYVFFKRIWPQVESVLRQQPRPWIFTGHSLGGALAMIAAMVMNPDRVLTFGAPKVGNLSLGSALKTDQIERFVNGFDLVPRLPSRDTRLRDREFALLGSSVKLDPDGVMEPFETADEELKLPFRSGRIRGHGELGPPRWLADHLIGEYCNRLARAASTVET